ncbi:MAG: CsgG/HfaB family protein [Spirochaetota bacterium]|nr:CsgG/HfaB family protein [Spirochaetota bacterium]
MHINNKQIIFVFTVFIFFISVIVSGAQENSKVKIAIMDFQKRGEATENEVDALSEVIRSTIGETSVFEVVERSQLNKLLSESKFQKTGLTDTSDAADYAEFGKIAAVKMLLIGTVGSLYGHVIITVRLVNAETGSIIFNNTLISLEEDILGNIKRFASEIADKGLLFGREVTREEIENDIEEDNYRRALLKIERYIESKSVDTEMLELKLSVEVSLSEENYKTAKKYLRKEYYREALDLINEAIILSGREQYYQFRDKIIEEQEEYSRKEAIRLDRIKQQQAKEKLESEAGYLSFSELASLYYQNITASGFHLGLVTGAEISEKNEISNLYEWWGGEFIYLGKVSELNDFVDQIWYVGLQINRKDEGEGYYSFGIQPWISPAFGFNLQIWNLLLNMGLDAGGIVNLNNLIPGGVELGFSAGAMALAEFKFFKSLGLYLSLKVDYEWIFDPVFRMGPSARLSAGLAF